MLVLELPELIAVGLLTTINAFMVIYIFIWYRDKERMGRELDEVMYLIKDMKMSLNEGQAITRHLLEEISLKSAQPEEEESEYDRAIVAIESATHLRDRITNIGADIDGYVQMLDAYKHLVDKSGNDFVDLDDIIHELRKTERLPSSKIVHLRDTFNKLRELFPNVIEIEKGRGRFLVRIKKGS